MNQINGKRIKFYYRAYAFLNVKVSQTFPLEIFQELEIRR